LNQTQLASRLGFSGPAGHTYISRLETGLIRRPFLDTIVHFLHACGARMSTFGELLDRVPPLPVSTMARAIVKRAWAKGAARPLRPPRAGDSPSFSRGEKERKGRQSPSTPTPEETKQHVVEKVEAIAAEFQRHVAYPRKGVPPPPEKLRDEALKLRDYCYQRDIIRVDVRNYLSDSRVRAQDNIWCQRLAVKFLSVLRKHGVAQRETKMAAISEKAQIVGMEPDLVTEIREIVEARWQMTFQANAPTAHRLPPTSRNLRRELELETAFLRMELYNEAYRVVYPLLNAKEQERGAEYCQLAADFYHAWVETRLAVTTGQSSADLLTRRFDALEQKAIAAGLVPTAVKAVRAYCLPRLRL
jgi:transcriptional regulator with XRE-family HTH domain